MRTCNYCEMEVPADAHPQAAYCSLRCKTKAKTERQKATQRRYRQAVKLRAQQSVRLRAIPERQQTQPKPQPFYRAPSLAATPAIQDSHAARGDMLTGKAASLCHGSTRTVKDISMQG